MADDKQGFAGLEVPRPASLNPPGGPKDFYPWETDYKAAALARRPLSDEEAGRIRSTFGGALDPSQLRLAYDNGLAKTYIQGKISDAISPRTIVMNPLTHYPHMTNDPTLSHEAAHIQQGALGGFNTVIPTRNAYDYQGLAGLQKGGGDPRKFSNEAAAEIIADATQKRGLAALPYQPYLDWSRTHPVNFAPDVTEAFLDSVRQRFQPGADASENEADILARRGGTDYSNKMGWNKVESIINKRR